MKKLLFLVLAGWQLSAQAQTMTDSVVIEAADSIGIKLAELAIANNPSIKVIDKQIDGSRYAMKSMKGTWLNYVQGSFNINENSLGGGQTTPGTEQNAFYPRYNLNIGIPLGLFFTKANQVKQSKAQYEEFGVRKDVEKLRLQQAVRQAYQNYEMARSLVLLQEMVVQDEQILYKQVEEKFKNNQVQLEIFVNGSKRYNAEIVKRLTLANTLATAKIDLETLLGMDLEVAMQMINGTLPPKNP